MALKIWLETSRLPCHNTFRSNTKLPGKAYARPARVKRVSSRIGKSQAVMAPHRRISLSSEFLAEISFDLAGTSTYVGSSPRLGHI